MNWVDYDACGCCESPYHVMQDCPIARQRVKAYNARKDRIIFGLEKDEDSYLSSSYYWPQYQNCQQRYYKPNIYQSREQTADYYMNTDPIVHGGQSVNYGYQQQQNNEEESNDQLSEILEAIKAIQEDVKVIR